MLTRMSDVNSELSELIIGRKQDSRCRYDAQAKRESVEACLVPGISVARFALDEELLKDIVPLRSPSRTEPYRLYRSLGATYLCALPRFRSPYPSPQLGVCYEIGAKEHGPEGPNRAFR
jgi:hypothetical protein